MLLNALHWVSFPGIHLGCLDISVLQSRVEQKAGKMLGKNVLWYKICNYATITLFTLQFPHLKSALVVFILLFWFGSFDFIIFSFCFLYFLYFIKDKCDSNDNKNSEDLTQKDDTDETMTFF